MTNVFTKIINREIPAYIVAEDENFIAFLDINPVKKGHTLVVPKKEIDYFFDIDDDLLAKIIIFSKKIAKSIKKVIPCKRIAMSVVGLEVPHAHIHLIPINDVNDVNFKNTIKCTVEEMNEIYKNIKDDIML